MQCTYFYLYTIYLFILYIYSSTNYCITVGIAKIIFINMLPNVLLFVHRNQVQLVALKSIYFVAAQTANLLI